MNDAVQSAMRRTFCVRCVSCEREKSGVADEQLPAEVTGRGAREHGVEDGRTDEAVGDIELRIVYSTARTARGARRAARGGSGEGGGVVDALVDPCL